VEERAGIVEVSCSGIECEFTATAKSAVGKILFSGKALLLVLSRALAYPFECIPLRPDNAHTANKSYRLYACFRKPTDNVYAHTKMIIKRIEPGKLKTLRHEAGRRVAVNETSITITVSNKSSQGGIENQGPSYPAYTIKVTFLCSAWSRCRAHLSHIVRGLCKQRLLDPLVREICSVSLGGEAFDGIVLTVRRLGTETVTPSWIHARIEEDTAAYCPGLWGRLHGYILAYREGCGELVEGVLMLRLSPTIRLVRTTFGNSIKIATDADISQSCWKRSSGLVEAYMSHTHLCFRCESYDGYCILNCGNRVTLFKKSSCIELEEALTSDHCMVYLASFSRGTLGFKLSINDVVRTALSSAIASSSELLELLENILSDLLGFREIYYESTLLHYLR